MKKFILALNYKNNLVDTYEYLDTIGLDKVSKVDVIIFPSFLQIEKFSKKGVKFGAQNVQDCDKTITGEISAQMLKKFGTKYCLVGHSERQESIEQIVNKIKELLKDKITPVLCVGESEKMPVKESIDFIKKVIDKIRFSQVDLSKIIVAYEPIYVIGKEESCYLDHIETLTNFIKQNYNFLIVLYGGSVNQSNLDKITKISKLDGVLIGKCSLNAKNIKKMIDFLEK
mgnify:CR=1 FL=1